MQAMNFQELRTALQKSKGRAVVLVHPYFHENCPGAYLLDFPFFAVDPRLTQRGRKYLSVQQKTIERAKIPVIIFEEEKNLGKTEKKIGRTAFFVPTREIRPTPVKGWENALAELRGAGLRHAIVGGQKLVGRRRNNWPARVWHHFAMEEQWGAQARKNKSFDQSIAGVRNMKNPPVMGCVGETIDNLLQGAFNVSIMPGASYPFKAARLARKK